MEPEISTANIFRQNLDEREQKCIYLTRQFGFINWIGHRQEIRKLTFRALAFRRRAPTKGINYMPLHIINPVDKNKLSCNTPTDAAPVSLETYPFYSFT